jgi:hypothetical protein
VGDKTDAACVVFVDWIVQTLGDHERLLQLLFEGSKAENSATQQNRQSEQLGSE